MISRLYLAYLKIINKFEFQKHCVMYLSAYLFRFQLGTLKYLKNTYRKTYLDAPV